MNLNIEDSNHLRGIVQSYFTGERQEMIIIMVGCAITSLLAIWLHLSFRDGFSKAFLITVLASSCMLFAIVIGLMVRDPSLLQNLTTALSDDTATQAISAERERVLAIIANYPLYRYFAAALIVAVSFAVLFVGRDWIYGLAVAVLLLAAAQLAIDYFSEARANTYLSHLNAVNISSADKAVP